MGRRWIQPSTAFGDALSLDPPRAPPPVPSHLTPQPLHLLHRFATGGSRRHSLHTALLPELAASLRTSFSSAAPSSNGVRHQTPSGRPPLSGAMVGHAANTDAASIWGTSTAPTAAPGVAVSRRSSSDRVDAALQSTSHRGVPHFLLSMQSTVKAKGLSRPGGVRGSWLQRLEGVRLSRGSATRDPRQRPPTAPPAPCSSVAGPVQLGCHPRAARLPRLASKTSSPTLTLDGAALPSLHHDAREIHRPQGRLSFHRRWSRQCTPPSLKTPSLTQPQSTAAAISHGQELPHM